MTDNAQLKARGVTGAEVEEMIAKTMFSSRAIRIAELNRFLGDKGLLIEHTPEPVKMVDIGLSMQTPPKGPVDSVAFCGAAAPERIYGMDVPPADQIPVYEVTPSLNHGGMDPPEREVVKVVKVPVPSVMYNQAIHHQLEWMRIAICALAEGKRVEIVEEGE